MPSVMKTLFLNPPSFDKFDGGAGSRWPATREIESYWYPVWLSYPAGMLPGSRLLDAPPRHMSKAEVVQIAKDYEFLVLFTSTVGFYSDLKIVRSIKELNSDIKVAFVGPQVQIKPAESLMASSDLDFVVRGEFDHAVVEFAYGMPLSQIQNVSYIQDGKVVNNPSRPPLQTAELDALPFATEVYQHNVRVEDYNVPFLLHPFVSFYTSRGCPALCTFCLWPQTLSGHTWRTRSVENVAREFRQAHKMFPQAKEFFFDDDTFNIRKDRVLALCKEFEPVGFRWSCTSRVHGDFIIGLPGETKETIEKTINFAKELDCETIQVSLAHAYPGTELYDRGTREGFLAGEAITDAGGHQLPHLEYPGLSKEYMVEAVNGFYDRYYFRPKVAWRIVRDALWDGHERKRLYHEAVDFLKLRADRKKVAREMTGVAKKALVTVPSLPARPEVSGSQEA